jgi:hypothetical protein
VRAGRRWVRPGRIDLADCSGRRGAAHCVLATVPMRTAHHRGANMPNGEFDDQTIPIDYRPDGCPHCGGDRIAVFYGLPGIEVMKIYGSASAQQGTARCATEASTEPGDPSAGILTLGGLRMTPQTMRPRPKVLTPACRARICTLGGHLTDWLRALVPADARWESDGLGCSRSPDAACCDRRVAALTAGWHCAAALDATGRAVCT